MSSPNQAYPVSGVSPLIIGGTGTAIKVFPAVSASLPVNPAQPLPPGQLVGGPAAMLIPANGAYEGQPFCLIMSGTVTVGGTASPTINFVIQNGSSLTGSSNTTMATLTAPFAATISTSYDFNVIVTLQGDSLTGKVVASPSLSAAQINGANQALTLTALTGISFLSAASTGQNPAVHKGNSPGGAALSLVCGVTFGVSDAANSASLMSFFIE